MLFNKVKRRNDCELLNKCTKVIIDEPFIQSVHVDNLQSCASVEV